MRSNFFSRRIRWTRYLCLANYLTNIDGIYDIFTLVSTRKQVTGYSNFYLIGSDNQDSEFI